MNNFPVATVRLVDGNLVIDDPVALDVISAVEKHNCRATLSANMESATRFLNRVHQRGDSSNDVVIVILNVDDVHGGPMAEALMPGYNWQPIRDEGQIPFARGLAGRGFIQEALGFFDQDASDKLMALDSGFAIVVVDHGVAEVFMAE